MCLVLYFAIYLLSFTENFSELKSDSQALLDNKFEKVLSGEDVSEIAKRILSNKSCGKVRIYPYVDFGIRFPLWLTRGFFDLVNPFTKREYMSLDKFNYGAKKFSDAIFLKPINEINRYCFASDYGLCPELNGVVKKDAPGVDRVKRLHELLNELIGSDSSKTFDYISNKDLLSFMTSFLDIDSDLPLHKETLKLESLQKLHELIKSMTKDFNLDSSISLIKNKNMVLSPLSLINILRFSLIKAASDNFVYNYTEKCLNDYCTTYNDSLENLQNNLSKLLFEPSSINLNTLDGICNDKLIAGDDMNIDVEAKNSIINILSDNKINLLKSPVDKSLNDRPLNELSTYIEKKNTEEYLIFCDKYSQINTILKKNWKNIYKRIIGYDPKILIDKLTEKKLLPSLVSESSEDDKFEENMNNLLTLYHKLCTLKKIRGHKMILKNLKKENIEYLKPFNYRAGINLTYYFSKIVGLNVDVSVSYSRFGFNKSIFLPNNFLPLYFYYLYELHVPALYGNIYGNENLTVDDVVYHNRKFSIKDIVLNGIIKNIANRTPLIGDRRFKDTYAFDNYLDVMNYYSDIDYSLCDISVKLEQINICLKFGFAFNLNCLINKNVSHSSDIMNEIITNFGLYLNFQRIKINVLVNSNYSSHLDNSPLNYFTTDILSDALVDTLMNLGIYDTESNVYNMKVAEMLLHIVKNPYNTSIIPKNNKILRYINSIFDDNLPDNSITSVFNTFKLRYLFEIEYRLSIYGYSIVFGCEFILNNPLNMSKKQIENLERGNNALNIKLPLDIEILPHIGFSKSFVIL